MTNLCFQRGSSTHRTHVKDAIMCLFFIKNKKIMPFKGENGGEQSIHRPDGVFRVRGSAAIRHHWNTTHKTLKCTQVWKIVSHIKILKEKQTNSVTSHSTHNIKSPVYMQQQCFTSSDYSTLPDQNLHSSNWLYTNLKEPEQPGWGISIQHFSPLQFSKHPLTGMSGFDFGNH